MRTDLAHAARLARLDLKLLGRNQTALFTVVLMPFLIGFVFVGVGGDAGEIGGVPARVFVLTALPGLMLGFSVFIHLVNIFTARREELVLKRLRGGQASPAGILGGAALGALVIFLGQLAVLAVGTVTIVDGPPPANIPLWLFGGLLGVAVFALLAVAFSGVTPSAEMAQITVLPPLLIVMLTAPFYAPTSAMPPFLRIPAEILPVTPVVEIMRTAYLGKDFIGGEGEALGFAGQWVAALPSFGILLAWIAVAALLARWLFRWDPRHG